MKQELLNQIFKLLESDYHSDIDLLIKDLKTKLIEEKSKLEVKIPKANSKPIIEIKDLIKNYAIPGEEIKVLKNIDLTIYEGEIIALVGPSGSGKSTLLNLIGGLDKPTSGTIQVHGIGLSSLNDFDLSKYRNQTIGFVFQFFNLQPYLNIKENVEIPLIFRGENFEERSKSSKLAIDEVGLTDRINHLPSQLSGGQMQRVAIARSIVNRPKIILADEPTGNLDRETGIEILNLIKKINKDLNTTIIIVTHDNFVANQADRIIKLSDGKVV